MTPDEIEKDRARIVMTDADLKQLLGEAAEGPWVSLMGTDQYLIWSGGGRQVGTAPISANARLIALAPTLAQETLDLRAKVARLRDALAWYAKDAWVDRDPEPPTPEEIKVFGDNFFSFGAPEVFYDRGERARAALGEKNDD